MEPQTDGFEWVLVVLFSAGFVAVLVAVIREFRKLRSGDPGGPDEDES